MALVTAVWPDPRDADRAVNDLMGTGAPVRIDRLNVAALVLTRDGRVRIHRDERTGKGVLVSGVLGAALGVLAGSPGWLLLGGGILERLAAAATVAGMDTGPLRDLADQLPPAGSAVIVVAAVDAVTVLHRQLITLGGDVTMQYLDPLVVQGTGLSATVRYDAGDVDGDVIAIRGATDGVFSHSTGEPNPPDHSYRPGL
jgi:uncharacterized membrane protein